MNLDRIINMVINQIVRRFINKGVNVGMDQAGKMMSRRPRESSDVEDMRAARRAVERQRRG